MVTPTPRAVAGLVHLCPHELSPTQSWVELHAPQSSKVSLCAPGTRHRACDVGTVASSYRDSDRASAEGQPGPGHMAPELGFESALPPGR